jgi:hypothetical protein
MITVLLLIRAWWEWKCNRHSAMVMVAVLIIGWLGIGATLLPQAPQFEMYDQWDAGWPRSHRGVYDPALVPPEIDGIIK